MLRHSVSLRVFLLVEHVGIPLLLQLQTVPLKEVLQLVYLLKSAHDLRLEQHITSVDTLRTLLVQRILLIVHLRQRVTIVADDLAEVEEVMSLFRPN